MVTVNQSSNTESEKQTETLPFRYPLGLTITALALGLSVEILFDGHPLGISFPIWAVLCVTALLGLAALEGIRPTRPELILAIPIMFFALMIFLRTEPLTVFLNVVLTLALFALWVRTFRHGRLIDFGWVDYGLALILVPIEAWIRPWPVAQAAWRQVAGERGERSERSRLLAVLRGLLLALPILVVFIALLESADLVFAGYVDEAISWLDLERLTRLLKQVLIVVLSAVFLLGALVIALRSTSKRHLIDMKQPLISPFLGFIESVVVLGAVDLLFAVFVTIQFAYLFGGQANITAAGYTYAEYARRGFGELVMVAFLSLGLIMALGAWTQREGKRQKYWFNGLSAVVVGLVGAILVSALKRLLLYENAYGFTRLRTYTHVAIVWMGILFIVFLALLFAERLRRFAPVVVLAVLGFAATLNLLNVDAFIVRQNTARLSQTGEIDIQYLVSLSDDAVPGLIGLIEMTPKAVRTELLPQLACRHADLIERSKWMGWPSHHQSRALAERLFVGIEDELQAYKVELQDGGWVVTGPEGEQDCIRRWD